jgi:hypothetical protein
VDVEDERHRQRFEAVAAHDLVDRVAVTGELLLVAVAKAPRLGHLGGLDDPLCSVGIDRDPFDRVRGSHRGDARLLGQTDKQLRELVAVERFLAATEVDPREDRAKARRLRRERPSRVDEALHRAKSTAKRTNNGLF